LPTAEICYGNRPASSPGNECLANIDNTGKSRVQFRQTWVRDIAPVGLTSPISADSRTWNTQIRLLECYSGGHGNEILISSWDRSNPDITRQTLTSGFASYASPNVVDEGLCFAEFSYTYSGQVESPAVAIDRWSNLTDAQPWRVAPTVYHRVAADFAAETLFDGTAQGDSRVFIDENAGYMHAYTPRMLMATLTSPSSGVAVPMYAVETKWQFNDSTFNCMGGSAAML
jgi:hypothetical protein